MCYDGASYNIIDWNKKTELELFPLKLLSNRTIFEKRVKPIQAKNENGRINFRKIVKILETLSSGGGGGVSLKVIYPFEVFFFFARWRTSGLIRSPFSISPRSYINRYSINVSCSKLGYKPTLSTNRDGWTW